MKQYIIVNTPNFDTFHSGYVNLASKGVPFTTDYIEQFTDAPLPGGWGCLRFDFSPPTSKVYDMPCVEFRYSSELKQWTIDGAPTEMTYFVEGVKEYFDSLNGGANG